MESLRSERERPRQRSAERRSDADERPSRYGGQRLHRCSTQNRSGQGIGYRSEPELWSARPLRGPISMDTDHNREIKVVYWHRDLPPLDAEMLAEHTVEAVS